MNEELGDFADKLNVYFAARHYLDLRMRRSTELYRNVIVLSGCLKGQLCVCPVFEAYLDSIEACKRET
jgi:hypothetical protein